MPGWGPQLLDRFLEQRSGLVRLFPRCQAAGETNPVSPRWHDRGISANSGSVTAEKYDGSQGGNDRSYISCPHPYLWRQDMIRPDTLHHWTVDEKMLYIRQPVGFQSTNR